MRNDYVSNEAGEELHAPENYQQCTEVESCSSSIASPDSMSSISMSGSDSSRPCSSLGSRPSSALSSRPSSALSSRPPSRGQSRPDTPSESTTASTSLRPTSGSQSGNITASEFRTVSPLPTSKEIAHCNENVSSQLEVKMHESTSETAGVDLPLFVEPSLNLIDSGLSKFKNILPSNWLPVADKEGFHLMLVSKHMPKAVQREIFVSYVGEISIFVHCVKIPLSGTLFIGAPLTACPFQEGSVDRFCEFGLDFVRRCLGYNVCIGANAMEAREVWGNISDAYIDLNPYKENKYLETCRSTSCLRLVPVGHKVRRCVHCAKVIKSINHRKKFLLNTAVEPSTANKYLTQEQALKKLQVQHSEMRKKDKQIAWLKQRFEQVLHAEGVNIDDDMSEDFSSILLRSTKLTDAQKMFLQEQWSCSQRSDSRAHRWHPSLIRLALHIKMLSTSAYEALRDSGIVKLSSTRTLFDYSHAIKAKDGVNEGLVRLVHDRVQQFHEPCQKYHSLLFDGMHVSQNLVFRSSDGTLVGFTNLDDIDKEMERLEQFVSGKEPVSSRPKLATEILAYMVKGIASDVKCVVASYPCKVLTKEMLYKRTWEVINVLEKSGVKILAMVCDGHPVNRAFFKMHTPLTKSDSGVVFDTLNFCSPDGRPLHMISDEAHLLKTIRNCFYNSGEGHKKSRLLLINGEKIMWKTIIRLYFSYDTISENLRN